MVFLLLGLLFSLPSWGAEKSPLTDPCLPMIVACTKAGYVIPKKGSSIETMKQLRSEKRSLSSFCLSPILDGKTVANLKKDPTWKTEACKVQLNAKRKKLKG